MKETEIQTESRKVRAEIASKLISDYGQKPYTAEELGRIKTFNVKARVGNNWFGFVTTTQFMANGLPQQIERQCATKSGVPCDPPDGTKVLVQCKGMKHGLNAIEHPYANPPRH